VFTDNSLLPVDPYAVAKVRELVIYSELHLELVARQLYRRHFFGGKVSDETKERTRNMLVKGTAGFARLARFSPFVAGPQFILADCAAIVHLPLVARASKLIYGEDLLAALPLKDYIRQMSERATVRTVNADRKANTEIMLTARATRN
jgi:glutathione S-transferase